MASLSSAPAQATLPPISLMPNKSDCHLVSGLFAQCLQILIGVLAMSTLLYKRYTEVTNQRPYEIWLMDISKQAVQSIFVHFANIALAVVFSHQAFESTSTASHDECAFYFISFVLDTFLGIHLIWLVLKGVRIASVHFNWASLREQGFYGSPPSFDWYFRQLWVFLAATALSKLSLGIVMFAFKNHIDVLGDKLFRGFHLRPDTELTFVMILAPACLNAVQYWLVDNILQSSGRHEYLVVSVEGKLEDSHGHAHHAHEGSLSPAVAATPGKADGVYYRVRTNS